MVSVSEDEVHALDYFRGGKAWSTHDLPVSDGIRNWWKRHVVGCTYPSVPSWEVLQIQDYHGHMEYHWQPLLKPWNKRTISPRKQFTVAGILRKVLRSVLETCRSLSMPTASLRRVGCRLASTFNGMYYFRKPKVPPTGHHSINSTNDQRTGFEYVDNLKKITCRQGWELKLTYEAMWDEENFEVRRIVEARDGKLPDVAEFEITNSLGEYLRKIRFSWCMFPR